MSSRIRELMDHSTRYCIDGRSRLIADTGVSRSEMTRLLSGDCNPSYQVVAAVVGVRAGLAVVTKLDEAFFAGLPD